MRIGLIAPPFLPVPPAAYGGTEAVIDMLALALADAGHDVVLAASADSTCKVERIPGFARSDPATVGSSLEEMRHVVLAYPELQDVDVIHDHTLLGPLYRGAPRGVPVVTTVHSAFLPAVRDVYRAAPSQLSIVAISHNQAASARPVRIDSVIHHGIDARLVPVGTGDGGYACFLGRMHPNKGVLEAIHISRAAGLPLRIAAKMREAGEIEYFRSVIQPQLGGGVEYLGEVNAAEKYELLGGAVALLNPIQWAEPFGMVMIEAFATGTPVVATHHGSAPEIVDDGQTGFLRSTTGGLASALARAGQLDRARCREAAEERFGAARMAADHLLLYSQLIDPANALEMSRSVL